MGMTTAPIAAARVLPGRGGAARLGLGGTR